MTPDALAALHALAFDAAPRPWSASEFAELLSLSSTLLATRPGGFAIGQVAGPEATLLTLAVHPDHRRLGLARALIAAFEEAARARGATESFLDVAETNLAARALYAQSGYTEQGRRRGYYQRSALPPVDALVLRKSLPPGHSRAPGKTI